MIRQVSRNDISVAVDDTDITSSWLFWDLWANGKWEGPTLDAIRELVLEGETFYDIGAWVGPISLWAAAACKAKVVALEPDPVAFVDLIRNRSLNPELDIRPYEAALAVGQVAVQLFAETEDDFGKSTSSMTRNVGASIAVQAITLDEMVTRFGPPDFVKMDIEGGESLLLPVIGPQLRAARVSMIVALHPQWYMPGTEMRLAQELSYWHLRSLADGNVLCLSE